MMSKPLTERFAFLPEGDELAVVENRHDGDDSDKPRPEIEALRAGDVIKIGTVLTPITSVGERVNFGKIGVSTLGIPSDAFGTVATLYVDRNPYRLDICNGRIYDIDPEIVRPVDEINMVDEEVSMGQ